MGMMEAGRGSRLVVEALQMPRVHCGRERQHLERHPAAQRDLLHLVDHSHAAAANLAENAKIAQRAGWLRGQRGPAGTTGLRQRDQLQRGKHLAEEVRGFGMAGGVLFNVRPIAVFLALQKLVGHAGHQ